MANLDSEKNAFSTTSITCDATGAGAWKKKKVSTCSIESNYLDSQDGHLHHIKRMCDTLQVDSAATDATLGILLKNNASRKGIVIDELALQEMEQYRENNESMGKRSAG